MPVRTRVLLAYAVIMALVLGAASALLISRLRAEGRTAVDAGLRSRASIILRDAVHEAADIGAPGRAEGVLDEAEVIAQIFDRRGGLLESTAALGSRPLLSHTEVSSAETSLSLERRVRVRDDAQPVRLLATRASNGLVVVVGASIEDSRKAVATLGRLLMLGGPLVLILTSIVVWALTGVALRPVERMRSEAEALSFDLGGRAPQTPRAPNELRSSGIDRRRLAVPHTRDELARLAETLNDMLGRLETAVERERRFVDDASHELRTPLAVLKTELELALRRARTPEELEASIKSAAEEVEGLSQLAEHLLILARADRGVLPTRPTRVDIAQLLDQVRAGYEQRAGASNIALHSEAPGPVWVDVDPLLIRQAVTNLVENALRHTQSGGSVSLTVSTGPDGAHVSVTDTGSGFDLDLLPRVFEPFTQTDGSRGRESGAGLGLAIVRAIAEAHGGTVEARNRSEGGASVDLYLPAA